MITAIRTETKTETTKVKIKKIACDCCKKEFEEFEEYQGKVDWIQEEYYNLDTSVNIINTTHSSDDYSWDSLSYHICPDCMKGIVFPFLKEKCGIPPHKNTDYDKYYEEDNKAGS